jgi:hypothetical protein
MAKIINFRSTLNKVSEAKSATNVLVTEPTSVRPDESTTPSTSPQPCRVLLRSLINFTDLLDKQIADIGKF